MFSCEFCEIFKNIIFMEHLQESTPGQHIGVNWRTTEYFELPSNIYDGVKKIQLFPSEIFNKVLSTLLH